MFERILAVVFLLCWGNDGLAAPMVSSGAQKYAVIVSNFASGQRNVRWETRAFNAMDKDGKPIKSGLHGNKGSYGCVDAQGKVQDHGAEYTRSNGKFKYRCNDGIEEVVACITSERAKKQWIKVGETLDVDGFWHKCESHSNNSVIYTQENSCNSNGKAYHVGEELQLGNLRMVCQNEGYKPVGCFYLDGSKKPVSLDRGEKKEDGKNSYHCEEKDGNLQLSSTSNGCTKSGKEYKEGETFQNSHLRYKCEKGQVDILGCYANENREMSIGQDIVDEDKHMIYRCYRNGDTVEYFEYACGIAGGAKDCKVEPRPASSDDSKSSLGSNFKSPGVSSFSIVQLEDNQMAGNPGKSKLQFVRTMIGSH